MQQLLKLVADPTRVRILAATDAGELAVNEIAEALAMSQSRISNHLRLLREQQALQARREGAWTFYRNALQSNALWQAVRAGLQEDPVLRADEQRRRAVLQRRRRRSRDHFAAHEGNGIALERGCLREELLAALAPPDWTVVDAGCGDGFLTELLAERFATVLAFDHSPQRLRAARRHLDPERIRFAHSEVDDLPIESGSADAIFLSMVLHHVPAIAATLQEARRVLRPRGPIVIADLAPHERESLRASSGDLRLGLDAEALAGSLREAGFEQVRSLPVRDRLRVGRRRYLDLILVAGRRPARRRTRRRNQ